MGSLTNPESQSVEAWDPLDRSSLSQSSFTCFMLQPRHPLARQRKTAASRAAEKRFTHALKETDEVEVPAIHMPLFHLPPPTTKLPALFHYLGAA